LEQQKANKREGPQLSRFGSRKDRTAQHHQNNSKQVCTISGPSSEGKQGAAGDLFIRKSQRTSLMDVLTEFLFLSEKNKTKEPTF
jgi:hypothetical protein